MAAQAPTWIVDLPPPNPTTTTRDKYTEWHTKQNCPTDADPAYQKLFNGLKKLYDALAKHEAMRNNLTQTFSTPAHDKNQVYFMWDFVGRTFSYLLMVDAYHPTRGPGGQLYQEATGRSFMSAMMITDKSGKMGAMTGGMGTPTPFGPEIEQLAADLKA